MPAPVDTTSSIQEGRSHPVLVGVIELHENLCRAAMLGSFHTDLVCRPFPRRDQFGANVNHGAGGRRAVHT